MALARIIIVTMFITLFNTRLIIVDLQLSYNTDNTDHAVHSTLHLARDRISLLPLLFLFPPRWRSRARTQRYTYWPPSSSSYRHFIIWIRQRHPAALPPPFLSTRKQRSTKKNGAKEREGENDIRAAISDRPGLISDWYYHSVNWTAGSPRLLQSNSRPWERGYFFARNFSSRCTL